MLLIFTVSTKRKNVLNFQASNSRYFDCVFCILKCTYCLGGEGHSVTQSLTHQLTQTLHPVDRRTGGIMQQTAFSTSVCSGTPVAELAYDISIIVLSLFLNTLYYPSRAIRATLPG